MAGRVAVRAALVDLSGTLHVEDEAVAGAVAAIQRLKDAGVAVRFLTNTTKESRRLLCRRLQCIGFQIEERHIVTSLTAARDHVVERSLRPYLLVDDAALEDLHSFLPTDTTAAEADAVLVGLAADKFDHEHLNAAAGVLLRGGPLIAIHKARYFRTKSGLSLGPGCFVAALEAAADCQAVVVGKPQAQFFLRAVRDLDCEPGQCVVVGDDVRDDVLAAQAAGLRGILVQTGKFRDGDEKGAADPLTQQVLQPNHVCASIVQAVDLIIGDMLPLPSPSAFSSC